MKKLIVSDNHRYLCEADGTPFFYLGDTAWELFHRLKMNESVDYLKDRAKKGFTVIQSVILAELDGLSTPNAQGDLPLIDGDITKPNPAFFSHVDAVVDVAETFGLFIGMLPTWGCYWRSSEITRPLFNEETAYTYGKWLGMRYKDKPVIWILGGDRNPVNKEIDIINQMAIGLREGDEGEHLITYHPCGPGQSSTFFHDAPWLDFNMNQTSHGARNHFN